jgi:hypothetical protein
MLDHVALVRTDVSGECIASIIRVTRTGELEMLAGYLGNVIRLLVTANVVPSLPILVSLMLEAICSPETSTSQEMAFFIVTALKTSNLAWFASVYSHA